MKVKLVCDCEYIVFCITIVKSVDLWTHDCHGQSHNARITAYLQMSVLMDTGSVPSNLRPYLSLYTEVILESPVLRDGSKSHTLFYKSYLHEGEMDN